MGPMRVFVAAVVLMCSCHDADQLSMATAIAAQIAQAPTKSLVPSTPTEAALDELRRRFPNQFVIGFEELFDGRPDAEPRIDLGAQDTTFNAALERLRKIAGPRYRVDLREGRLVHVYPTKGTADPVGLLDIRINDFRMPQDQCLEAAITGIDRPYDGYAPELDRLLIQKQEEWYRSHSKMPPGVMGSTLGNCFRSTAPGPSYPNITVREALNLLALRSLQLSRGETKPIEPLYGKPKPLSWKFRFRPEPDTNTGFGGVPLFQTF